MPSAAIRDVAYDEARNELTVCFTRGKTYTYALVPASIAAEFRAALSKGAFFNERIRDKYPFARVKGEASADSSGRSLLDALKASKED